MTGVALVLVNSIVGNDGPFAWKAPHLTNSFMSKVCSGAGQFLSSDTSEASSHTYTPFPPSPLHRHKEKRRCTGVGIFWEMKGGGYSPSLSKKLVGQESSNPREPSAGFYLYRSRGTGVSPWGGEG
jgi:hypothetical protein